MWNIVPSLLISILRIDIFDRSIGKLWRDGLRYSMFGDKIQRWLCRRCGLRFSDPIDVQRAWSRFERVGRVDTKSLKADADRVITRQICVAEAEGTKNLAVEIQKTEIPRVREIDVRGKLVEHIVWMENQCYASETIRGHEGALRALRNRGADLLDPVTVSSVIAKEKKKAESGEKGWKANRRRNVITAYALFAKRNNIQWEKPKCTVPQTIPFIPKEEELDALIAGSGKKSAAFQQVMKETAFRPGEANRLQWTDIDEERHLIRINDPEKGSNSGVYKVSPKLIGMLQTLPRKSLRIFGGISIRSRRTTFERTRKRLAEKLANPRLLQISFATYRHWKATTVQHEMRDTWYVKCFLRHKSIQNTEKYIYIEHAIFGEGTDSDQFISKVAQTQEEIEKLIETGFEYVLQKDDLAYFRKRK